ncbi:MAG: enoyl-CoA hydratase/isomerase family protein [Thauera sp.]|nr:enoyl-CoA hydratase/isomerase family protein [Thauera sp.]
MSEVVVLNEIVTACGRRFGHARLNAPAALNALSLEMIELLDPQLERWLADPEVVGVVLDGEGERAFCAGGDVRALQAAIVASHAAGGGELPPIVPQFFEREYRLDHRIHTSPKPILCWGQGVVMGGGVGLMSGASHRVVTPSTRLAMPEITIGLYPDVGGSWFLNRMPGRIGLFLALTGVQLNAADVRFAGLADFVLASEARVPVLEAIAQARWSAVAADNHRALSGLLGGLALDEQAPAAELAAANLRRHFDRINAVIGHDGLLAAVDRLAALTADEDPWLAGAARTFSAGAPSSALLSARMLEAARHCSLAEVFRLEYQASVNGVMAADFAEGVRALLVDKDRQPRWQDDSVAVVDPARIEALLAPRFSGSHPLADLG